MFRLIKHSSNGYIGEKERSIAYCDGSFFGSMKGRLPSPNRRVTNPIKKVSKDSQRKTEFIYAAEAFTSQV